MCAKKKRSRKNKVYKYKEPDRRRRWLVLLLQLLSLWGLVIIVIFSPERITTTTTISFLKSYSLSLFLCFCLIFTPKINLKKKTSESNFLFRGKLACLVCWFCCRFSHSWESASFLYFCFFFLRGRRPVKSNIIFMS